MQTQDTNAPRPDSGTELSRRREKLPSLSDLPDDAFLVRAQAMRYSNHSEAAYKKWAREGRGPEITYLEGRPRYQVGAFKRWLRGSGRSAPDGLFA